MKTTSLNGPLVHQSYRSPCKKSVLCYPGSEQFLLEDCRQSWASSLACFFFFFSVRRLNKTEVLLVKKTNTLTSLSAPASVALLGTIKMKSLEVEVECHVNSLPLMIGMNSSVVHEKDCKNTAMPWLHWCSWECYQSDRQIDRLFIFKSRLKSLYGMLVAGFTVSSFKPVSPARLLQTHTSIMWF